MPSGCGCIPQVDLCLLTFLGPRLLFFDGCLVHEWLGSPVEGGSDLYHQLDVWAVLAEQSGGAAGGLG